MAPFNGVPNFECLLLTKNKPTPVLTEAAARPDEAHNTVRRQVRKASEGPQTRALPRTVSNAHWVAAVWFGVGGFERLQPLTGGDFPVLFQPIGGFLKIIAEATLYKFEFCG